MTYRPDSKKLYIILRQEAGTRDYLKAAFAAHTYLWLLDGLEAAAAAAGGVSGSSSSSSSSSSGGSSRLPFLPFPWLKGRSLEEEAQPLLLEPSSGASKKGQQQQQQQQQKKKAPAAARSSSGSGGTLEPWQHAMEQSISRTDSMFGDFIRQAEKRGWKLDATMLNPKEVRLLKLGSMG
jgi:hypothetical protein